MHAHQFWWMYISFPVSEILLPSKMAKFPCLTMDKKSGFKSRSLIQLCNIEENEQEVCHKYWPVNEGEGIVYGPFDVTLQSETISEDYVVRKLYIVSKVCFHLIAINSNAIFIRVQMKGM